MAKWFKKQSKQREALHNPTLSQPQIEDNLLSSIHSKKILLKQLKPQCLKLCVSSKCPDLACLCQAPSASNLQNRERSAVTTAFDSTRQNPLSVAKSRAQMSLWYRVKYLVILEGKGRLRLEPEFLITAGVSTPLLLPNFKLLSTELYWNWCENFALLDEISAKRPFL